MRWDIDSDCTEGICRGSRIWSWRVFASRFLCMGASGTGTRAASMRPLQPQELNSGEPSWTETPSATGVSFMRWQTLAGEPWLYGSVASGMRPTGCTS